MKDEGKTNKFKKGLYTNSIVRSKGSYYDKIRNDSSKFK